MSDKPFHYQETFPLGPDTTDGGRTADGGMVRDEDQIDRIRRKNREES